MVGIDKIPESRLRWNTNEEILLFLTYASLNQEIARKKIILRPKNGALFIYDRNKVRYRQDGYEWKKRKDGRNVREDHMKLKVNGVECIYGCYVHSETVPNFHRRCYWKLKNPKIVLVHYLFVPNEISKSPTSYQLGKTLIELRNIFGLPEPEETIIHGEGSRSEIDKINKLLLKKQLNKVADSEDEETSASQIVLFIDESSGSLRLKKLMCKTKEEGSKSEDKITQTDEEPPSTSHHPVCSRDTSRVPGGALEAASKNLNDTRAPLYSNMTERLKSEYDVLGDIFTAGDKNSKELHDSFLSTSFLSSARDENDASLNSAVTSTPFSSSKTIECLLNTNSYNESPFNVTSSSSPSPLDSLILEPPATEQLYPHCLTPTSNFENTDPPYPEVVGLSPYNQNHIEVTNDVSTTTLNLATGLEQSLGNGATPPLFSSGCSEMTPSVSYSAIRIVSNNRVGVVPSTETEMITNNDSAMLQNNRAEVLPNTVNGIVQNNLAEIAPNSGMVLNDLTAITPGNRIGIIPNNGILPGNGTGIVPNNRTGILPNNGSQILLNNGTGILLTNGTGIVPNSSTGIVPNSGTGIVPNCSTGIVPNSGTGILPNNGTGIVPNSSTGMVSNSSAGILPNNRTGILPNTGIGVPSLAANKTSQIMPNNRNSVMLIMSNGAPLAPNNISLVAAPIPTTGSEIPSFFSNNNEVSSPGGSINADSITPTRSVLNEVPASHKLTGSVPDANPVVQNDVSMMDTSFVNKNIPSDDNITISTVCPDWCYTSGGQKIIIVGDWKALKEPCSVLFGNTVVPAQQLKHGVISVLSPPSSLACTVPLHIMVEGSIVSHPTQTFTYKEHYSPNSWLNVVSTNFQHSLINRLEALESQVQILSNKRFSGDLQTRLCNISLRVLSVINKSMYFPPAPRGLRLIHLAAAIGYSKLVILLLKFSHLAECNPCSIDDMGNNAVVWGCVGGNPNTVYLLLKYFPHLRTSRDGWGRPIRILYRMGEGRRRGDTAARIIQLYYRTYKQRMEVKNAAATRIQAKFRGYKQQCQFELLRKAVITIQQTYRDHVKLKSKEIAAKTIQRRWRQRQIISLANSRIPYFIRQ